LIPLPEFVHRLRLQLDKAIAETSEGLLGGDPDNFADYKMAVGQIAGLRQARQEIDDLVKAVNEGG
jgi:hypothetical protein